MIAVDCDKTLFSRYGTLSAYSAEVLKKTREKGIRIVICTGRPEYSVRRSVAADLFDYAVCMNGQEIVSADGAYRLKHRNLSSDEIRELIRQMESHPVMMFCSDDDVFYALCAEKYRLIIETEQLLKNTLKRIVGKKVWNTPRMDDYGDLDQKQIGKICFSGFPHRLSAIKKSLDEDRYSASFVTPYWLEVQPPGISKGAGLRTVMELCGIAKENTAAIGDGENDLPMFDEAGTRVAMKNAMHVLKKHADIITDHHYIRDGAARWINSAVIQPK